MKKSKTVHIILLTIILGALLFPLIQKKFNVINVWPLNGAVVRTEPIKLSIHSWFSGEYQVNKEKVQTESFGFRELFIKANNQIDYTCFHKFNAMYVEEGKNKYMYELNYIKAYYGDDFVGEDSISLRLEKLKFVQNELKKRGKTLLVVLAPGKGSYYPEFIPDRLKSKKKRTNYEVYAKLTKQMGIETIDFHSYFEAQKYKSKYPLYPQFGIHWSVYGGAIATDSIIRYIEKVRNVDLANLKWNSVKMEYPFGADADIIDGLNLLVKYPTFDMAYPNWYYTKGKTKTRLLVVADSFYWIVDGFGLQKVFANKQFWYYNKNVYSESNTLSLTTDQMDLNNEIENHDVFMIMCTDANLPNFGWGAVERFYNYFKGKK